MYIVPDSTECILHVLYCTLDKIKFGRQDGQLSLAGRYYRTLNKNQPGTVDRRLVDNSRRKYQC